MQLILFVLSQCIFYANGLVGQNVRQAQEGEFPFIVALKLINTTNVEAEKDFICSGVMISNINVLTIAHNIYEGNMQTVEIVYHSNDLRQGARAPVQWLLSYNQWATQRNLNRTEEIDLSILKLVEAINVPPVILSGLSKPNLYRLKVITAGWGNNAEQRTPRMMETVELKILRKSICKNRILSITHRSSTKVHKKFLCSAAEPYAFLRQGDSGGPLLYHNQLVAINKGSCPVPDEDLNPRKVNIHIAIDEYRDFFADVINNFE